MELTKGEKLILVMLADIQQALDVRGEVDPAFVKAAILGNKLFGLEWQYSGLLNDEEEATLEDVREVSNILEMWSMIETYIGRLDQSDRDRVAREVPHQLGVGVLFPGFDGNYETEQYSIAKFLISDMHRWSEFSERDLNSHHPTLDAYRRMYAVYEPIRNRLGSGPMTADHIIAILSAW